MEPLRDTCKATQNTYYICALVLDLEIKQKHRMSVFRLEAEKFIEKSVNELTLTATECPTEACSDDLLDFALSQYTWRMSGD